MLRAQIVTYSTVLLPKMFRNYRLLAYVYLSYFRWVFRRIFQDCLQSAAITGQSSSYTMRLIRGKGAKQFFNYFDILMHFFSSDLDLTF